MQDSLEAIQTQLISKVAGLPTCCPYDDLERYLFQQSLLRETKASQLSTVRIIWAALERKSAWSATSQFTTSKTRADRQCSLPRMLMALSHSFLIDLQNVPDTPMFCSNLAWHRPFHVLQVMSRVAHAQSRSSSHSFDIWQHEICSLNNV